MMHPKSKDSRRTRFRVTLEVHTEPRFVELIEYGDTPQQAIEKAIQRLGPGYVVISKSAMPIEPS